MLHTEPTLSAESCHDSANFVAAGEASLLDTVTEDLERAAGADAVAVGCARALGVRPEVVRIALASRRATGPRTPLEWIRRLLDVESALA